MRVHGSVGKLSDGVKIKNRNHTYVLGLFSWSLTKILVDYSHVLITHLNKAGYYLIGGCIKYLVLRVRKRNRNKDQISNDKYYCLKNFKSAVEQYSLSNKRAESTDHKTLLSAFRSPVDVCFSANWLGKANSPQISLYS